MTDWRIKAEAGLWRDINWSHLAKGDLPELLERLQRAVPKTKDVNGVEERERYILPKETSDPHLKTAARLLLGELEAAIMDEPPQASEEWRAVLAEVTSFLRKAQDSEEATEGHPELSRRAHATMALDHLDALERRSRRMAASFEEPEERHWLLEGLSEIAQLAYAAGRRTQIAIGKELEVHTVRGRKSVKEGKRGGEAKRLAYRDRNAHIVGAMKQKLASNPGKSVSWAANWVYEKMGLGRSAGGNRNVWRRFHQNN